jgi:sulfatase maturation enzyme AslB (radical SAM superfamily)
MGGVTKETHEKVMKGTDFDLVCSNVKRLIELGVKFEAKINPTKQNFHEFRKLPELIESWGGQKEQVRSYTTCYPIPATASKAEKDQFFDEVVSSEVEPFLRFTYDLDAPDYNIRAKQPGCHFMVDTIFFDGQLTMCCHDQLQQVNIGNVLNSHLEAIRASKEYETAIQRGKQMQHVMCKECN